MDCFTIALGKKTGTTFPITFDNKRNYNALYDTGTGTSLINYSAYVSLGQDLDTGYQPFVKNATGEDMGALGQVTCTFTINDQPFTQSFIVVGICNDLSSWVQTSHPRILSVSSGPVKAQER